MNVRVGWTVVGVLVCLPGVATAEEEPPPQAVDGPAAVAPGAEPAVLQRHRLTLGMSIPGPTGGVGGVGAVAVPAASVGYETLITGPAWFMIGARGGIDLSGNEHNSDGSWFAAGNAGFRLEAPVHEYVEVGGYGRFDAAIGQSNDDQSWQLGAEVGAGLHFRPTRLFGVRLSIEVLDWGYSVSTYQGVDYAHLYAHLKASPSLDLTFSL